MPGKNFSAFSPAPSAVTLGMNRDEIEAANQRVIEAGAFVQPLLSEVGKVIVGQSYLMERLVISLLANGHVLLEGVPGWPRRWRSKRWPTR